MQDSWFNQVYDTCRALGCRLGLDFDADGAVSLTIEHPERGPLVTWTAFSGDIEEAARYAVISAQRLQRDADNV